MLTRSPSSGPRPSFGRANALVGAILMGGALAVVGGTAWAATDREQIEAACTAQLSLKPGGCDCVADRAEAELDDQQRRFLILNVTGDKAAAQQMQMNMTQNQLLGVGMFMANAPGECNQ